MITQIKVENFKAFAEKQIIPLRPITLIFGPNSAGKSSILHSLLLLNHAASSGDFDVQHTRLGGESVDLGGFERYVHGRDPGLTVAFSVTADPEDTSDDGILLPPNVKHLKEMRSVLRKGSSEVELHLEIGQKRRETTPGDYEVVRRPHLRSFEVHLDGQLILRADIKLNEDKGTPRYRISKFDTEHPALNSVLQSVRLRVGNDIEGSDWETEKEWLNFRVRISGGDLGPSTSSKLEFLDSSDAEIQRQWEGDRLDPQVSPEEYSKASLAALALFLCQYTAYRVENSLSDFQYLGPLRSYPPRRFLNQDAERDNPTWRASGERAWELLRDDSSVAERVNEWLGPDYLETGYRLETSRKYSEDDLLTNLPDYLQETIALSVARVILEDSEAMLDVRKSQESELLRRLMPAAGAAGAGAALGALASPMLIAGMAGAIGGVLGKMLSESSRQEGAASYPEWIQELQEAKSYQDIRGVVRDIVDSAEVARAWIEQLEEDQPETLRELKIVDQNANVRVSHRDIGVGISQVLPVLAYAQAFERQTLLMEQPELHLHPRLQTRLGDILIDSVFRRENQFIIETHSEHLILRLMRRIRETNEGRLPEGKTPLSADELAVVFVDSHEELASIIRVLDVDEDGELIGGWPGTFFDEDFEEQFA